MATDNERKEKILNLFEKGVSQREIAKQLNCGLSIVSYYCGRNKYQKNKEHLEQIQKDNEEVENLICNLIKTSDNINQVCQKLGKKATNTNYLKIKKIIEKYNLDTSHFCVSTENITRKKYCDDEIFTQNSTYIAISKLRDKLIKGGYKEWKCECCQNTDWQGKPIPLQTHHINGDRKDNRIENLQLLCPNCHCFTDTYCGSNIKQRSQYKKKKKICPNCGKEFYGTNKFCTKECFEENKKHTIESKGYLIPDKESILKLASEGKTMKEIERYFKREDNGLRNYCKKFNIPIHIKELQEYAVRYFEK